MTEARDKLLQDIADILKTEKPVEKFVHHDDQWQFEERRQAEVKELRLKLADRQSSLRMLDRLLTLEGQAGYTELIDEVERRRDARRYELETTTASDSYLRVLQGKCQELAGIAILMRKGHEQREALAEDIQNLEDELKAYDQQPKAKRILT